MAVLGNTVRTLADWAKQLDPDGKPAAVVELLSETNELLPYIPFKEANGITHERVTVRTGLPTVYWRILNQGVPSSKSRTAQVDESMGMLEAYSECDKDLCELNGNTQAYRLSEASSFFESMNQEMLSAIFYGNSSVNPEQFNGLHVRFSSLSAENAENIIDCDSSADGGVTSMWMVKFGANTVHGIFPKGSQAGLMHEDLGLTTIQTDTTLGGSVSGNVIGGGRMRAYVDHWQWKMGLVVRDWRAVVRACNIDVSDLDSNSGAADLGATLVKMIHRFRGIDGNTVILMNRTVAQAIDLQARSSVSGGALGATFGTQYGAGSYSNFEGRPVMTFRGIPVIICDAILTTESVIS
jgi:hypothetical protein